MPADPFARLPDLHLPDPAATTPRRVAIVGAGIAGLVTARLLTRLGWPVTLFEKARGPGGRLATRRETVGHFDHGTQYFCARDPRFQAMVDPLLRDGVLATWQPRFVHLDSQGDFHSEPVKGWLVGAPRMSALTRALAEPLTIVYDCRIATLEPLCNTWLLLADDSREFADFDVALLACPAPQAAVLAAPATELAAALDAVTMLPCWAAMLALPAPLDLPWDAAQVDGSPLAWIANNSTKPGRADTPCWVLHATHEWSIEHEDDSPTTVARALAKEFLALIRQPKLKPAYLAGHRWRYARPDETLGQRCLFDPELGLGAAGDWCLAANVEGAFLSGVALAEAVANGTAVRP